jgi:hypothetical protein
VRLYQDTNNNGVLDSTDVQGAAPAVSDQQGAYAFANLTPGRYFVKEAVPSGYVRTAPALGSYATVNLADGQAATGQDFANFQKPTTNVVTDISFTVTNPTTGVSTVVTNLRGQTHQGDVVTANFIVPDTASNVVVSLVVYDAPGASFDANTASQQVPIQIQTGTFQPGPGSFTVTLPNNFYQVDFVLGSTIDQLGPAGSNHFYSAQGRLLSADNNGSQAAAPTLTGTLFDINHLPPVTSAPLTLTLTGFDAFGNQVSQTTGTLDTTTGFFSFTGLQPGVTYVFTVTDSSVTFSDVTLGGITTNGSSITNFDVVLQPSSGGQT